MPRTARRTVLRTAAAALSLALVPALAACGSGVNAGTTRQGPSGNGSSADLGPLQLRGMTIVTGTGGAATIIGTLVNTGSDPDSLVAAKITTPGGATVALTGTQVTGGALPLPGQSSTRVGFNSTDHLDVTGLTIPASSFADVVLEFKTAGQVTVPMMAVLPQGIYENLQPLSS